MCRSMMVTKPAVWDTVEAGVVECYGAGLPALCADLALSADRLALLF